MLNRVRPLNKSLCLQSLCEENYLKLKSLVPCFEQRDGDGNALVKTTVLDRAPFTYTLSLAFGDMDRANQVSTIECRVYLDTQSVDVISIAGVAALTQQQKLAPKSVLTHKWNINYFFEKWLTFQLSRAHEGLASQPTSHV